MVIVKCLKPNKKKFGKFIEEYLKIRKEIALIVFLIDIRHTPGVNDQMLYNYIISIGIPCLIIANKCDKIAPTKIPTYVEDLQKYLNPLRDLTFLPFSSEKKIYCDKVWEEIEKHL